MSEIIVIHDSFDTVGGAEHVAVIMAKIFNVPIYTTTKTTNFYDDKAEIIPLVNQEKLSSYALKEIRNARIFKRLKFNSDIILSSGDKVKFYIPSNNQKHINYTYTPPRMYYDLRDFHKQRFKFPKSVLFELFSSYQRQKINEALKNIDELLCLSEVVKDRIKKYWNIEAKIVYPPVETFKYRCKTSEGYFLYISRLSTVKRTDVVLDIFDKIDDKLVVVGKDEEEFRKRMKSMVNVDYKGQISEDEKIDLLAHCEAVIYPPIAEDFGLVPIEAFASGKPVIGVREGFTQYQIKPYINGLFIERPTPLGIKKAIKEIQRCDWSIKKIQCYAKKYDISEFKRKIKEVVQQCKK